VRSHFRPEFLNRVDEMVVFEALTPEQLAGIVEIQLRLLRERLADRDLDLEITEAAAAWLAKEGYDPAYGARPLKRLIQRSIENELAMRLLRGEFRSGQTVMVDVATAPDGQAELTFGTA